MVFADSDLTFKIPENRLPMVRVRINNTVIEAYSGDITELGVDAIVIGANPMMEMNEGIAAIVKEKGGREIEEEAMSKIPVETGEAIVTSAGALMQHMLSMQLPFIRILQ
ncbi:MAG: macro domain-containing protein [Candidatus Syntropharchaeia archaeon]